MSEEYSQSQIEVGSRVAIDGIPVGDGYTYIFKVQGPMFGDVSLSKTRVEARAPADGGSPRFEAMLFDPISGLSQPGSSLVYIMPDTMVDVIAIIESSN